jgi:hypothetical protein
VAAVQHDDAEVARRQLSAGDEPLAVTSALVNITRAPESRSKVSTCDAL